MKHFKGNHILGIYPLLPNNTCYFIAADMDNHDGKRSPLEDVKAYYETCEVQEFPSYVLRSKSGNGYHVYIFFNSPVPAWKARTVVFALLQEAAVIGDDIELSSFDRLFPNQDRLSGKGFGNLIALPLQGQAARKGHTLFLNPDSGFVKPFGNQWELLTNLKKVDEPGLDELIKSWDLKRSQRKVNNGGMANPEGWLLKALMGVEEGNPGRDTTGTRIAGYFINKLPKKDILTILTAWNTRNKPPLNESAIRKIVDSVYRYRKRNADEWEINLHFTGCEKSSAETPASG